MNNQDEKLHPQFVTGFVDADGCFSVIIEKPRKGWGERIKPTFYITQQAPSGKGVPTILRLCEQFFAGGHYLRDRRSNCYTLRIHSLAHLLERVIPHFLQHPLHTEKKHDFLLFQQICHLLQQGAHHNQRGRQEIKELALSMNKTGKRYKNSPKECKSPRADQPLGDLDPYYVSGLTQGAGCFTFAFRLGPGRAYPGFSQHALSLPMLGALEKFFQCGNIYATSSQRRNYTYLVTKWVHIKECILPHFKKYPLLDEKGAHFSLFQQGCDIFEKKLAKREKIMELVHLLYESNCGGKPRGQSKWQYLQLFHQEENAKLKV